MAWDDSHPTRIRVRGTSVRIYPHSCGSVVSSSKDPTYCLEERMSEEDYNRFDRGERTDWLPTLRELERHLIAKLRALGKARR